MRGKLFVIDGVDGSGKETQAKLLLSALQQKTTATYFDFPQYQETIFGRFLGQVFSNQLLFDGKVVNILDIPPHFAVMPYMLDRVVAREKLWLGLEQGHVVCNRYTTSNLGHQAAKVHDPKERDDIIQFVESAEYDALNLPRPDSVIFLDISIEIAHELGKQKSQRSYIGAGKHDQTETNKEHQTQAADIYRLLAQSRPDWHIVQCMENGILASREAIHSKVWEIITSSLGNKE